MLASYPVGVPVMVMVVVVLVMTVLVDLVPTASVRNKFGFDPGSGQFSPNLFRADRLRIESHGNRGGSKVDAGVQYPLEASNLVFQGLGDIGRVLAEQAKPLVMKTGLHLPTQVAGHALHGRHRDSIGVEVHAHLGGIGSDVNLLDSRLQSERPL